MQLTSSLGDRACWLSCHFLSFATIWSPMEKPLKLCNLLNSIGSSNFCFLLFHSPRLA
jgi:hypothetical protein